MMTDDDIPLLAGSASALLFASLGIFVYSRYQATESSVFALEALTSYLGAAILSSVFLGATLRLHAFCRTRKRPLLALALLSCVATLLSFVVMASWTVYIRPARSSDHVVGEFTFGHAYHKPRNGSWRVLKGWVCAGLGVGQT